ncbi:hypothetical protein CYMTET_25837 [Cymbomonas tetramitiformis]|uniref:Protein-S-isoprenylcysteine O-methyltransferase n=1 Tax=Cymbomonas tetramitiformis TaxID=36881 RepID=A0AAE0FTL7_9CHLO|nr:hypothetical protein CYMTET_49378 [Cymbomonas tetramitiformis]KAK3265482.1 hypothetical protein CYMTET_25837 [Cymbomonas tetramitiformis]
MSTIRIAAGSPEDDRGSSLPDDDDANAQSDALFVSWIGRGVHFSLAQALLVPAALPWSWSTMLFMVPASTTDAAESFTQPAAQLVGVLLATLGVAMMASGIRDIGSNFSFFPEPKPAEEHSLSTVGIMGVVRHPQYAGTLAFCWGVALVTGASPTRMLACMATTIALWLNADLDEDRLIKERYGRAADEYLERVPSMVPRDACALIRAMLRLS